MKATIMLLSVVFLLQSCLFENDGGELMRTEASPSKGFNYPYFLFIPEGVNIETELVLIVEPNNSGFTSDDLKEHEKKALRTASKDFYTGNYVSRNIKIPLLIPVFTRPENEWKIYSHAFDRDVAIQKNNELERIDLQLLAMVEDAKNKLKAKGYKIHEQIFMTGFSASGTFTNRFTAIHPETIKAAAAGGVNGLLILPLANIDESKLDFPLGVNDFQQLFNKQFDSTEFFRTPQFYFMGALDDNDAIPYEDGYDIHERELVFDLLSNEMMPTRWGNCIKIYQDHGVKANFKTYEGIGHEQPKEVKEDILTFFKDQLDD
jgi:hypothetical protein